MDEKFTPLVTTSMAWIRFMQLLCEVSSILRGEVETIRGPIMIIIMHANDHHTRVCDHEMNLVSPRPQTNPCRPNHFKPIPADLTISNQSLQTELFQTNPCRPNYFKPIPADLTFSCEVAILEGHNKGQA